MGLSHLRIPHRGERDRERAVGVATPAPSQAQGEGRELRGARQSEWVLAIETRGKACRRSRVMWRSGHTCFRYVTLMMSRVVRKSLDDLAAVERQIPVGARLSQIHEEVEDEFRMREDQAHALRRVRMRNRTRRIVTGQRDPSKCLASVAVVKAESESGETHFVARD